MSDYCYIGDFGTMRDWKKYIGDFGIMPDWNEAHLTGCISEIIAFYRTLYITIYLIKVGNY